MTKEQYLNELRHHLRRLPKEDFDDAMEYFTEYFNETDEEGAKRLMDELGTPKEAAADLLAQLLEQRVYGTKTESGEGADASFASAEAYFRKSRKHSHTLLIAVLTILAAPVGLPLLIAGIACIFAVLCTIVSLVFALAVVIVSMFFAGGWLFVRGILAVTDSISGALIISGTGFAGIGIGLLGVVLCIWLWKLTRIFFVWIAKKITTISKRGKNHRS